MLGGHYVVSIKLRNKLENDTKLVHNSDLNYFFHPLFSQALLASGDGPIALILAPTHELVVQIQQR